jgi:hypothetical protein
MMACQPFPRPWPTEYRASLTSSVVYAVHYLAGCQSSLQSSPAVQGEREYNLSPGNPTCCQCPDACTYSVGLVMALLIKAISCCTGLYPATSCICRIRSSLLTTMLLLIQGERLDWTCLKDVPQGLHLECVCIPIAVPLENLTIAYCCVLRKR